MLLLAMQCERSESLDIATQATPVIAGIAVGAAAYAGKAAIEIFTKFRNAPPRLRQFYKVRTAVCRTQDE